MAQSAVADGRESGINAELAAILGSERVFDDRETLESYSKDSSFTPRMQPRCIVKPGSKADIQAIVGWANSTRTPLVPVSSGPPHHRGDTIPCVGGAVVMDLSGMKRIIEVDRKNRMAIVEPGVTFEQLLPEAAKEGLKLSLPLLPRASKSVMTSVLEREPVMVPKYQWQIIDPLRFLEVVWGGGDTLRTGEGGLYPALEEGQPLKQTFPMGPLQTDYYRFLSAAQGSMGIVAWAALKCEVLPSIHNFYFIPAQTPEALFDFAYKLLRFRYGDELFLMNNVNLAYIAGETPEQIRALKGDLPPWACVLGIAGRERLAEERVEFQRNDISEIAQQFGLKMLPSLPGITGGQMARLLGEPSKEPHWKIRYRGAAQDIFFLTTLDKTADFVNAVHSVTQAQRYPSSDVGIYLQPAQQGASCHCEFTFPYDPENGREVKGMQQLFTAASEKLVQQGAYFSRPYGIWAPMTYNRDAQSAMTLMKIKGIFDPNNVMNPGKLFNAIRSI